ncbi:DNA mismatch endonuclease Vsr [Microbulbifer sp. SAOS-129_SWC]|uniref:very short patch repair endonuclease n=1 Tax=Microbulbifer sp. SAOS-129_SWC TaxID=3145235 RepID=UPI003216E3DB
MGDIVTQRKRSEMMSGIKGKNTKPELLIRRALFKKGYRYRLHRKDLPGKPDLVLPKYKAVIFVNGCFWHAHDCHLFRLPKTRHEFWKNKISKNVDRDIKVRQLLKEQGWRVLDIWECAVKGKFRIQDSVLIREVEVWLSSREMYKSIKGFSE